MKESDMGLDMYAYAKQSPDAQDREDLAYWRKHANLHGWMQRLHAAKGGNPVPEAFNCVEVELTASDLDLLQLETQTRELPKTTGFFFGESTPEDDADTLAFIKKAREALAQGRRVFYNSWW